MKRVAILKAGAIGDLLQSIPAVRSYKLSNPDHYLTLICGLNSYEAVKNLPYADNIVTFDERKIYSFNPFELFKLAKLLFRFDRCFVLQQDARWSALLFFSFVKERFGISEGFNPFLQSHCEPFGENRRELYLKSVELAGELDNRSGTYEFFPDSSSFEHDKKYVAIATGGGRNFRADNPQRRWQGFTRLIELLLKEYDYDIILLGLDADRINFWHERVVYMYGKTTLSDAFHIISGAELFIGNDSGLLHLAGCCDVPKIGIYGGSSPDVAAPEGVKYITASIPCVPCERRGRYNEDCKIECLASISSELVMDIVKSTLKN